MRGRLQDRLSWKSVLLCIATVFHLVPAALALSSDRPPLNVDGAVFEHSGWYITTGANPYIDVWDPKPPLVPETNTLFAYLSGGDMVLLHALAVLTTVLASIGTLYLTGLLTYRLTQNPTASLAAGCTPLLLEGYYALPAFGFRPKYVALFAGLLAIYLALDSRWLLAGAFSAASAGYWQFGAIFAAIVLGLAVQTQTGPLPRRSARVLAGMGGLTVVVLLPIVYWDALVPMFAEVVLAPIYTPDSGSPIRSLGRAALSLEFMLLPVTLGGIGVLLRARDDLSGSWWVLAGGSWALLQVMFLDYDSYPDLYLGLVFASIGVGMILTDVEVETPDRAGVVAVLLVVAVASTGLLAIPDAADYSRPAISVDSHEELSGGDAMTTLYWEKIKPSTCHYRQSQMEVQWANIVGHELDREKCGSLPPGFPFS